jgi:hypothetical protein
MFGGEEHRRNGWLERPHTNGHGYKIVGTSPDLVIPDLSADLRPFGKATYSVFGNLLLVTNLASGVYIGEMHLAFWTRHRYVWSDYLAKY